MSFVNEIVTQLSDQEDPALAAFLDVWFAPWWQHKAVESFWSLCTDEVKASILKHLNYDAGEYNSSQAPLPPFKVMSAFIKIANEIKFIISQSENNEDK